MSSDPQRCVVSGRSLLLGLYALSALAMLGPGKARAESCPTAKDEIATDRPDVTNSSLVIPQGSFQQENGIAVEAVRRGVPRFAFQRYRYNDLSRLVPHKDPGARPGTSPQGGRS